MQGSAIAFINTKKARVVYTACCGDVTLDLSETPSADAKAAAEELGWEEIATGDPDHSWLAHEARRQFSEVGADSAVFFRFVGQRKLL
ncbi:hypothetical protein A2415_05295 [candidate division WWE3 bacterium RIFOXYC1_FULL_39_7]|uniref:Uncharacterized protein n=1 Tax=candidate division WWE3 bacterium RIFOXYC1_FULL_39_7 TaxID=1802643 RepID=A0A1F4WJA7_UNCKA|nr:MAG: hypothetical protein A2415_05295 [candidate division WWE3 bacterium RIFOXYC1_FULL_39_7]